MDEKFRIKPCLLQCVSSGKRAKNCFFLSHTEILLLLQVFYIITMLNVVLNFPHASSSSVLTTRTVSFQSSNVLDSLPADTHMMPFCTWCISSQEPASRQIMRNVVTLPVELIKISALVRLLLFCEFPSVAVHS